MSNWQNRIIRTDNVDPRSLIPNPENIKEHSEYQRKVMDGVLEDIGWIQNVVVNETTGHIIDGHMRVENAIANDEKLVPVVFVSLTQEEEEKALMVFDPVSTLAKQSKERMADLIQKVQMSNASAADFVRQMAKKHKIDTDQYNETDDEEKEVTVPEIEDNDFEVCEGDLYEITGQNGAVHRMMCADNTLETNWKILLGNVKPVLAVTSPPYNQKINKFKPSGMQKENTAFVDRMASSYEDDLPEPEYQAQQIVMVNMICSHLAKNGSLFYNHKIRYREKTVVNPLEWLLKTKYPVRQEIIWDRGGSVTLNAKMFIPCEERIYWIRVGDSFIFNDETEIKSWSTIWKFAAKNDVKVTAAYPFELPYRCIIACSKAGDSVIDPYCGSGTTIVAANRTGRRGFGFEISPDHMYQALKRFEREGMEIKKVEK